MKMSLLYFLLCILLDILLWTLSSFDLIFDTNTRARAHRVKDNVRILPRSFFCPNCLHYYSQVPKAFTIFKNNIIFIQNDFSAVKGYFIVISNSWNWLLTGFQQDIDLVKNCEKQYCKTVLIVSPWRGRMACVLQQPPELCARGLWPLAISNKLNRSQG